MHVTKFAGKITSRISSFPFNLINKAISSSKMAPTVKANDPVIDNTGKASIAVLCQFYSVMIIRENMDTLERG